jgi:hypothetical protein
MADILYLSVKKDVPACGYWDQTFIHDLVHDLPNTDRQIVCIPGAYQGDVIDKINVEINKFPKVLVFVTSDEECKFNVTALKHPDMIVYSQYGNEGISFPIGYSPQTPEILKEIGRKDKDITFSFMGQVTHLRREIMAKIAENIGGGLILKTDGFAKGMKKEVYLETLARSQVALCSPGPFSQDSFRLYEALEAGCIPIVDDVSPMHAANQRYVRGLFPDAPFPIYANFVDLPKFIENSTSDITMNSWVYAWWINVKYRLKTILKKNLGLPMEDMVVIIPVSPIPSHPSTEILDETIKSIRFHTDAPILVTIDGVRDEQKDMEENYQEFIRNFLWKCNFEYKDVLPILFPRHYHQSGMMKYILPKIGTKLLLYVEQDTPLVMEHNIEWDKLLSGVSNCIRFHFEAFVPEEHRYLMRGTPKDGLLETKQWSQRPHLASTWFYKGIMELFSENADCFIEDFIHGQLQSGDWNKWRVHIYHPEGNIKRSYHTDGRAGNKKFDEKQIW